MHSGDSVKYCRDRFQNLLLAYAVRQSRTLFLAQQASVSSGLSKPVTVCVLFMPSQRMGINVTGLYLACTIHIQWYLTDTA